jgi:hypothetical protein
MRRILDFGFWILDSAAAKQRDSVSYGNPKSKIKNPKSKYVF